MNLLTNSKGGQLKSQFFADGTLLETMKKAADQLVAEGKEGVFVPVGQADSKAGVWLVSDAKKVVALGIIETNGKKFYYGPSA